MAARGNSALPRPEEREGHDAPAALALEAARLVRNGVILGPLSTYEYPPRETGAASTPSAGIPDQARPLRQYPPGKDRAWGVGAHGAKPVDLVNLPRKNTEGFYADRKHVHGDRRVHAHRGTLALRRSARVTRESACEPRIARRAFRSGDGAPAAKSRRYTKPMSSRDLRWVYAAPRVRKVAQDFPKVQLEEVIVDRPLAALLLRDPMRFRRGSSQRTCTATSFRTKRVPSFSGGPGSRRLDQTPATAPTASPRPQHGSAPGTVQVKTRRIPPRSSFPQPCCSNGSPRGGGKRCPSPPLQEISTQPSTATLNDPRDAHTADLGGKLSTGEFASGWWRRSFWLIFDLQYSPFVPVISYFGPLTPEGDAP